MQFKPITAIIVLLLVVVSLSVAGCTVNFNAPASSASPTSTPIPTVTTPTIASKETVIGDNTTFSSSTGFSIMYPTTLKKDSTNNASVPVRIYIYLATNNTADGVVVGLSYITASDTLSDWVNFNMNTIKNYPNFQQISTQSTTIGGKPAKTIVWQATVPVQMGSDASTIKNTTLKAKQTYVVNNNKGYAVTYKAIPGDYNMYLAQAQQIIDSFELN